MKESPSVSSPGKVTYTKRPKETQTGIPDGAKVIKEDVSTSTRQIENGYVTTKNWDVKYETKSKDGEINTGYAYYSKEWYSKEDPLTITVNDKSLAEAFKES